MDDDFVTVVRLDELPPGAMKRVWLGEWEVLLANVAGTIHAVQNRCLHAGGPLSGGTLEGSVVTCPWHGWRWDLQTGRGVWPSPDYRLRRFPVRVVGDEVQVKVPR